MLYYNHLRLRNVGLFVAFLLLFSLDLNGQGGVWNAADSSWNGQNGNTWKLKSRISLIGDSGRFAYTRYATTSKIQGYLEYTPNGYATSPAETRYPVIIYFPGCGEIHNGRMYLHDDGSPNYNFGLGRLFAQGTPPVRDVRVDVGNTGATVVDGKKTWWTEDIPEYTVNNPILLPGFTGTVYSTGAAIDNTLLDGLYQNGREGTELRYSIRLIAGVGSPPGGTYRVTLHFAETSLNATGNLFNIIIEGVTRQSNYDIFAAAGGQNRATTLSFDVNPVNGPLDITLQRVGSGVAKVAAIEVVQVNQVSGGRDFPALPQRLRDQGDYFSNIPVKTRGVAYDNVTGPKTGAIILCMQYSGVPEICGEGATDVRPEDMGDILALIQREYPKADLDRIYFSGMSAGGKLAWLYPGSSAQNNAFAAVAPVCAVAALNNDPTGISNFYNSGTNALPIVRNADRCNNGTLNPTTGECTDGGIPVITINRETIDALRAVQPIAVNRFESYFFGEVTTNSQHDAWTVGYDPASNVYTDGFNNYNMYEWLLLNVRSSLLPVSLQSFGARRSGNGALVEWSTSTESNSGYFTLERSLDGTNFKEIARINAAGNSTTVKSYNHFDTEIPSFGYAYYRLRQTDKDGKTQYFGVRKLFLGNQGFELKLFPTLTSSSLNIDIQGVNRQEIKLRVVDLSGKLLLESSVPARQQRASVNVSRLAPGVYILQATSDGYAQGHKFIKQ